MEMDYQEGMAARVAPRSPVRSLAKGGSCDRVGEDRLVLCKRAMVVNECRTPGHFEFPSPDSELRKTVER